MSRRRLMTVGAVALLAGCQVVPKGPPVVVPAPVPTQAPPISTLPTDSDRHRIALLVPMTGANAAVGQSIANATTMALLDTNAANLRITTYDTATGASSAATRAIADGNRLILGPLTAEEIPAVASVAQPARIPVISYSNDARAASGAAFIMGAVPGQSVARTVAYARSQGAGRFAALIPSGEYGQRASAALVNAVRAGGGTVIATETFDRTAGSLSTAARRLRERGGIDTVLIADGGRIAAQAAPLVKQGPTAQVRLLGTELWSGENLSVTPSLRGAWFSALSDARYRQFSDSYRSRFGNSPYRLATLGYDSVLLTLRVARDWRPGTPFPTTMLRDRGGFIGLDGPFRFGSDGVIERAFEVRQVTASGSTVVSPAPTRFE